MDAQISEHYPDIVQAGNLESLLNRELKAIPSSLRVQGFDTRFGGSRVWASAQIPPRNSDICAALGVRQFQAPLWHAGVQLASVATSSAAEIATALHAWLVLSLDTRALKKAIASAEISPVALDYEAGPEAYVAAQWRQLLGWLSAERSELFALGTRAFSTPELSALLPYTSHDRLCFSRYTGYPFSTDTPFAATLGSGRFRVFGADGFSILGEGDSDSVVGTIIRHLPFGCKHAIHGTSEQETA